MGPSRVGLLGLRRLGLEVGVETNESRVVWVGSEGGEDLVSVFVLGRSTRSSSWSRLSLQGVGERERAYDDAEDGLTVDDTPYRHLSLRVKTF